jgi:hypothetical protein
LLIFPQTIHCVDYLLAKDAVWFFCVIPLHFSLNLSLASRVIIVQPRQPPVHVVRDEWHASLSCERHFYANHQRPGKHFFALTESNEGAATTTLEQYQGPLHSQRPQTTTHFRTFIDHLLADDNDNSVT